MAIEKVVLEESIVFDAVRKCIVTFTMLFSVQKLTSVNRAIFPDLLALSVRQITQPFASVGVLLGFVYEGASSLGNVVSDLPFVVTASAENEPALSVGKPVGKGPYIVASIFKEQLTVTMRLFVFPGASVSDSRGFDQVRRPCFSLH